MDALALVLARVLEGEAGDARGGFLGDDLQALHHAGHDFVLDAGVQALGVLADDDQVHVGVARRDVRKIADGAEVGVQLEALAQGDVDAGKAAADGRGDGALERDMGALEGVNQFLGKILVVLLESIGAGFLALPLKLHPGGFEDAHRGRGDLGANAVAGDEGDSVGG